MSAGILVVVSMTSYVINILDSPIHKESSFFFDENNSKVYIHFKEYYKLV